MWIRVWCWGSDTLRLRYVEGIALLTMQYAMLPLEISLISVIVGFISVLLMSWFIHAEPFSTIVTRLSRRKSVCTELSMHQKERMHKRNSIACKKVCHHWPSNPSGQNHQSYYLLKSFDIRKDIALVFDLIVCQPTLFKVDLLVFGVP